MKYSIQKFIEALHAHRHDKNNYNQLFCFADDVAELVAWDKTNLIPLWAVAYPLTPQRLSFVMDASEVCVFPLEGLVRIRSVLLMGKATPESWPYKGYRGASDYYLRPQISCAVAKAKSLKSPGLAQVYCALKGTPPFARILDNKKADISHVFRLHDGTLINWLRRTLLENDSTHAPTGVTP
jgi:hypothetical protein